MTSSHKTSITLSEYPIRDVNLIKGISITTSSFRCSMWYIYLRYSWSFCWKLDKRKMDPKQVKYPWTMWMTINIRPKHTQKSASLGQKKLYLKMSAKCHIFGLGLNKLRCLNVCLPIVYGKTVALFFPNGIADVLEPFLAMVLNNN